MLEIVTDPSRFSGQCLTVTGPSNGALIYSGLDGYYLAGPLVGSADEDGPLEGRVLGLYPIELMRWPTLWHVRATGILGICSEEHTELKASSPPGSLIFMTGYCHYANGPFLSEATIGYLRPIAFERKVGEEQRRQFGDLAIADASWAHFERVVALADQFLAVIQRGDTTTILELHGLTDEPWPDEVADTLAATFGTHSAFGRINENSKPQRVVLVDRSMLTSTDPQLKDDYSATICFCLEEDCTRRWPIARIDADNVRNRPYACTIVGPIGDPPQDEPRFRTPFNPYTSLAEPMSSTLE